MDMEKRLSDEIAVHTKNLGLFNTAKTKTQGAIDAHQANLVTIDKNIASTQAAIATKTQTLEDLRVAKAEAQTQPAVKAK